jgi:transcription initiation factor TFIID subunit TAF12
MANDSQDQTRGQDQNQAQDQLPEHGQGHGQDQESDGASAPSAADVQMDTDRRTMRRAKTDVFVNRFLNGHPYLCRMTDISLSGARLVAINEPRISPPPSYMGLQFQLPGRREVMTASGVAVTCADGHAVGVRFTRLPAAAAAAIEALLGPA